jgi:C4-type Zn-finger protein
MIRIEPTSCPCCDTNLDEIEPIDRVPEFGTVSVVTICDCCGHLMLVQPDFTLRELTTAEHREMINRPKVIAELWRSVN